MRRTVLLLTSMLLALLLASGVALAQATNPPEFAPPKSYDDPGKGAPIAIAKGDFDEDGVADLVLAATGAKRKDISLFTGKPAGTFSKTPRQLNAGRNPSDVLASDLDDDGHLDLALSSGQSTSRNGSVVVRLGRGDGTFEPSQGFPSGGKGPTGLAAADVDGDDDEDLAVANSYSDNLTVLLNDGQGAFSFGQSVETRQGPIFVAAGNFVADDDPDLVVTVAGNDAVGLLENNAGSYEPPRYEGVGEDPQDIIAGFFDDDANLDFATANAYANPGDVSVRLGNGDGTFAKAGNGEFPSGGSGPTSLTAADFNGDGNQDLAVTNIDPAPPPGNVGVLTGEGDGTFESPETFRAGKGPAAIVQGDFNGDGKPDLAVANEFSKNLSILINTTPGS